MADRLQSFAHPGQMFAVEIEADQSAGRSDAAQQLARMTAPAERAIDGDLAFHRVQGGQHFV